MIGVAWHDPNHGERKLAFADGSEYPWTEAGFEAARLTNPNPGIRALMESFRLTGMEHEKRCAEMLNDQFEIANVVRD